MTVGRKGLGVFLVAVLAIAPLKTSGAPLKRNLRSEDGGSADVNSSETSVEVEELLHMILALSASENISEEALEDMLLHIAHLINEEDASEDKRLNTTNRPFEGKATDSKGNTRPASGGGGEAKSLQPASNGSEAKPQAVNDDAEPLLRDHFGPQDSSLSQLQFLEPDLGPAVLPLHVPNGYFVPFVPRRAFGVANGVARPPHGHASFYRHRPRGLVDVRNSPAFGFLLGGP